MNNLFKLIFRFIQDCRIFIDGMKAVAFLRAWLNSWRIKFLEKMNIELTDEQKIKITNSDDVYGIMQRVLLREQKVDQDREHLWTVCLDNANRILNIELVSMGNVSTTTVLPMEVFSIPLQKRTVKIIIVHNHPSGSMKPSEADKDLTDRLIQVGLILDIPVLDHLIISTKEFYSFADSGLLDELEKSLKYVAVYRQKEMAVEKAKKEFEKESRDKAMKMAKEMKKKGYPVAEIAHFTGLSEEAVEKIKVN